MDEFLNIDWNPRLEDMLDCEFINYQRLQRESAMYRNLRGTLQDPFVDTYKDFEHAVTQEMMAEIAAQNAEKRELAKAKNSLKEKSTTENVESQEPRSYIPGIIKSTLLFSKYSNLTAQQQALALRVLLRFSSSEKPSITATDKEELQTYMSLIPIISKEQDAFLELAKKNWDPSKFEIHEEEFINLQWKKRVKLVESMPRYYTETKNVPLISSKEIGINFHSICLQTGNVPKIFLPRLTRRILMPPNTTKISHRFFSVDANKGSQENVIFKIPVSQDRNCEILAKEHEVDLVISSGGLNCLALNMDPNIVASWILPITVKRINEKNVVFVDKPLPPTGLTVMQKNAWLNKYNIKSYLAHPFHYRAARLDDESEKAPEESNEFLQIDEKDTINFENDIATDKNEENGTSGENVDIEKNKFLHPPAGHNLFYRLFSIGSSDEMQNDLMKNRVDKVYKLLVRSKVDGSVARKDGQEELTMLAPKLEHQLAIGAEAVTVEEAAKQWMSLIFRPDTSLIRVRMEATSTEFIQFEKRTAVSINNEIKRLYGLKTEAALTLLYNVAETMTAMNPGRYLMRHTIRNGAFAIIYKEADGPGKNVFDLQTVYWESEFPTVPNPPWPALDKGVVTPCQKCFKRMPAMFNGRKINTDGRNNGGNQNERGGRGRGRGGGRGRGAKKNSARGRKKADPVPE